MKELVLSETKREIPKTGITVLIRDNVTYYTYGEKNVFIELGHRYDEGGKEIRVGEIKDTDILYQFPENTDIYKTFSQGRCLDRFLLKPPSIDPDEMLIKAIKDGKIIGAIEGHSVGSTNRYHITIKDSRLWISNQKKKQDQFWSRFNGWKFFEFDTIYELGKWFYEPKPA